MSEHASRWRALFSGTLNRRGSQGLVPGVTVLKVACLLGAGCLLGMGCRPASVSASTTVPTSVQPAKSKRGAPQRVERPIVLDPLSQEQQELARWLKLAVSELTKEGQRNVENSWGLASATDYLFESLESWGYSVTRQGFSHGQQVVQNLVAQVPGRGRDWLVLGARFDSAKGSPGANDGASGAALLLALARAWSTKGNTGLSRGVKFVWLSDAAMRSGEGSGAEHAAILLDELTKSEGGQLPQRILGFIELGGLGYYSTKPASQSYPADMPPGRSIADFVELVAYAEYVALGDALSEALAVRESLPVRKALRMTGDPRTQGSAHAAFLSRGIAAAQLWDTHGRRSTAFGTKEDTLATLDFGRMARLANGLDAALSVLLQVSQLEPVSLPKPPLEQGEVLGPSHLETPPH